MTTFAIHFLYISYIEQGPRQILNRESIPLFPKKLAVATGAYFEIALWADLYKNALISGNNNG